jgi:hypothetical protein
VDEIFQRALALRGTAPVHLYDPCCGAAYHLAVLGYLHRERIASLTGSDVDAGVLAVAQRNLALLTPAGLAQRRGENQTPLPTHLFQADATQPDQIAAHLPVQPVDLVLTDVPYDRHSAWQLSEAVRASPHPPLWHLLEALTPFLSPHSLVALAADKAQKSTHPAYRRVERFQIGKRHIVFLQRNEHALP